MCVFKTERKRERDSFFAVSLYTLFLAACQILSSACFQFHSQICFTTAFDVSPGCTPLTCLTSFQWRFLITVTAFDYKKSCLILILIKCIGSTFFSLIKVEDRCVMCIIELECSITLIMSGLVLLSDHKQTDIRGMCGGKN